MGEKRKYLGEIAKVGCLIGCGIVFGVLIVYMWASNFFTRSIPWQVLLHQIISKWILFVLVVAFLMFVLFVAIRLGYLISNMTTDLFFEYKWRNLSKQKRALEKDLKQFYSALKRIHIPLAITKGRRIVWSNNEMRQLVRTKPTGLAHLEILFPKVDLPQKMSSIIKRLAVQTSYTKKVFILVDGILTPVELSAVCLNPLHPEQGILWSMEDAMSEYQNSAMERYYDVVFNSLKLFRALKGPEQEQAQLEKMLKNVSVAYNLTLAGIVQLDDNRLITKVVYSDGKFSSIPSQFDLRDAAVKTSAIAKAIKTRKCVGYSDVAPLPYYHFLKDTNKESPQSTCAFPIIINHHLEGVITLYGSERNFFSPRLLQRLNQLFQEVFQAIGAARWRNENKQAVANYAKQLKIKVAELEKGRRILKKQAREMNGVVRDMIAARNQAEEASQVKSDFLASVSHELRTPLNAILGFSEAIETETFGPVENPRYKEYNRYIYTSGKYLLSLINDVLDLSAVESKHKRREEAPLNLNKLVTEAVEIIKGYPGGSGKQFIIHIPDNIRLMAEDRSVRQIFLNVLSNAVKFTGDDGKIEITARINTARDLRVVVEDNGIGIPKDKIKTLFQPFVQVENVMTREHKGSGLGLVLVKKLMESYQGSVALSSKLGSGTKMILIFPQKRVIK
ncbi:MAG: hypothetical protein II938_04700 [Alphaproteobacteria bacterium]|nr:hypothetical protein [Alphaproteobacteria bacterium]